MLTHLPGRMSQPSRKGVTSNIFILRCSFHETAKRLSITSLTRLLRPLSKIQSSIVRHDKMSILVIPVILLQTKRKRNTKYRKTLNCQNERQNFRLLLHGDTKKKSRIGLLHRNQFAEGIQLTWTIISQIYRKKKDLPKSANDTIIYRLSLWYNNERLKLPIPKCNTTLH